MVREGRHSRLRRPRLVLADSGRVSAEGLLVARNTDRKRGLSLLVCDAPERFVMEVRALRAVRALESSGVFRSVVPFFARGEKRNANRPTYMDFVTATQQLVAQRFRRAHERSSQSAEQGSS